SRRCAVMPSAPASIAIFAARTGSGCAPPRALRMVATWSTLTPRRRWGAGMCGRGAPYRIQPSRIHALGIRHHVLGAQLRDDRGEMLEVVDLKIDHERREVGRIPGHADVVDVNVMFGDNLPPLGERPGLDTVLR